MNDAVVDPIDAQCPWCGHPYSERTAEAADGTEATRALWHLLWLRLAPLCAFRRRMRTGEGFRCLNDSFTRLCAAEQCPVMQESEVADA